MIVLDTDQVSELQRRDSKRAVRLLNRLARQSDRLVAVTIASIVLAQKGTLLSANLRDFRQVPNLAAEDWLSQE